MDSLNEKAPRNRWAMFSNRQVLDDSVISLAKMTMEDHLKMSKRYFDDGISMIFTSQLNLWRFDRR